MSTSATARWEEGRWGEDSWPIPTNTRLGFDGVGIQIWANSPGFARWGEALWGSGVWSTQTWISVSCQVLEVQYSWGASRALGLLSQAQGGTMQIRTYDPDRVLDPANQSSPVALDLFPGGYLRVTYQSSVLAIAVIDTIEYSTATKEGMLGGTDPVGVLSNISLEGPPANPPATLRAFARFLVTAAALKYVTVEPDPPEGDPPIGEPVDTPLGTYKIWDAIAQASIDALNFAWVGSDLVMRFRSHGDPVDRGLQIGLDGIAPLELVTSSTADGIINDVISKDISGPQTTYRVSDAASIARFGRHTLDRTTRKVPNHIVWADRVLADRSRASLEYLPASIVPTTPAQLAQLVSMQGIELVRVRLDEVTPQLNVDMRSIGLQMAVDAEGWRGAVLGYQSAIQWEEDTTPPPVQVLVPNIVGTLLSAATAAVQAAGLVLVYTEVIADGTPVGTVLSQEPPSAVYVTVGTTVTATVAIHTVVTTVPVPNVSGVAEATATATITGAGLVLGARTTATNALAAGLVISTTPVAGTIVALGSSVAYLVSTGPVRVTRSVVSTKSALVARSNVGTYLGAGAATDLPVGLYSGYIYRSLVEFVPNFANVTKLVSATLRLQTSTQVRIAFGSSPKVRVQRITTAWTEGTSSTPSASNAVVYPGPSRTSTGEVVAAVTRSENATQDIDVTGLVNQWLPLAAGGGGQVNRGLAIIGYTESSTSYTTEFDSDDFATAGSRPELVIVVETV